MTAGVEEELVTVENIYWMIPINIILYYNVSAVCTVNNGYK